MTANETCPESGVCLSCQCALLKPLDVSFCTSFFSPLMPGCDNLSTRVRMTVGGACILVVSKMVSACMSPCTGYQFEMAELPLTLLEAQKVLRLDIQLVEDVISGTADPTTRQMCEGGLFSTAEECRNGVNGCLL